jgi:hypothetical protein
MNTNIKDFISVIDDPSCVELCNSIINAYKEAEEQGLTINRQQEHIGMSKLKKDDNLIILNYVEHKNLCDEVNNFLWNKWYPQYAEQFDILPTLGWHTSLEIKVQKTSPGGGYHVWHCEQSGLETSRRILTWILYLNDVEDGGETEFLYQHRRVSPRAGRFVLWPASFTHTHRGNPPLNTDKYIATGWITYEPKSE